MFSSAVFSGQVIAESSEPTAVIIGSSCAVVQK